MILKPAYAAFIIILFAWGCSPAPRYTSSPGRAMGGVTVRGVSAGGADSTSVQSGAAVPEKPPVGFVFRGMASYYADKYHGRKTASGETFDMYGLTCAHNTLSFDTWIEVRNLKNNRTVIVRVNDRGPFVGGRIIDLSLGAAKELDMIRAGVLEVECKIIK